MRHHGLLWDRIAITYSAPPELGKPFYYYRAKNPGLPEQQTGEVLACKQIDRGRYAFATDEVDYILQEVSV